MSTSHRDEWITHTEGRLFARRWSPAHPAQTSPIVLLHESLGCVALWRDFPATLSQATGRDVVAYDRLGFGQSTARNGRPMLDFVGEEAARYLPVVCEQLRIQDFVVLGHSVGGGMAIECAATLAGRCQALITISAQTFPEDCTLQGIRAAQQQFNDPTQVERLARYHGDKAPWVLDAWIGTWLDPDFAHWSLADVLPAVRCPVLAIHGEQDEYGSTAHPRMISQHSGGPVQTAILPGVGHVPHREQQAEVLALVARFLAG